MTKPSRIALCVFFTLLHYALTFAVFLIMASYAGNIEGFYPPLPPPLDTLLTVAFYLLLFPLGFAPFGVLFNSALLGFGLYYFSAWRAKKTTENLGNVD